MDFMDVMALLAFLSTLGLYGTSLPQFPILLRDRRSDLVQFSALVLKLLNNVFSLHYALLAAVHVSSLSNGLGVVLHLLLCLAYLHVAPVKSGPLLFLLVGLCFYAGVAASYANDAVTIGLTSSSVRTLAYASPALTVAAAARTGNVEAISPPLACGALVCQTTWYVYGGLIDNPFVQLPNLPGIAVQLTALFLLWRDERKVKSAATTTTTTTLPPKEPPIDADNNLLEKKME